MDKRVEQVESPVVRLAEEPWYTTNCLREATCDDAMPGVRPFADDDAIVVGIAAAYSIWTPGYQVGDVFLSIPVRNAQLRPSVQLWLWQLEMTDARPTSLPLLQQRNSNSIQSPLLCMWSRDTGSSSTGTSCRIRKFTFHMHGITSAMVTADNGLYENYMPRETSKNAYFWGSEFFIRIRGAPYGRRRTGPFRITLIVT